MWNKVKAFLSWPFKKAWGFLKGVYGVVRHPWDSYQKFSKNMGNLAWAISNRAKVSGKELAGYAILAYIALITGAILGSGASILGFWGFLVVVFLLAKGPKIWDGYKEASKVGIGDIKAAQEDIKAKRLMYEEIANLAYEVGRLEELETAGQHVGSLLTAARITLKSIEVSMEKAAEDMSKNILPPGDENGPVIDVEGEKMENV